MAVPSFPAGFTVWLIVLRLIVLLIVELSEFFFILGIWSENVSPILGIVLTLLTVSFEAQSFTFCPIELFFPLLACAFGVTSKSCCQIEADENLCLCFLGTV